MMKVKRVLASLALLVGAVAISAAGTTRADYVFTVFDGPGSNAGGTTVNGINNNGDAVGFSAGGGGLLTNFIRNPNGSFTTLNIRNDPTAMANGINDSNQVVGVSGNDAIVQVNNLFVLPKVNANSAAQVAFGINNGGTIVGQYVDSSTDTTPGFVYKNGAYTVLNPVANALVTNAQGVNSSDLVTGFYSTDGTHQHGFLFDLKTDSIKLLADPSVPNLLLTQFLGINDKGLAVGYYQTSDTNSQHGFIYNIATATYTFLDAPGAASLNGTSITQLTGINNKDQISGFFVDANGFQRGFVATPTPEPGSMALFGIGALGLTAFAHRKKMRLIS
jgi:hypothetical protein